VYRLRPPYAGGQGTGHRNSQPGQVPGSSFIRVTVRQQTTRAKSFTCRGKNGGWSANTLEIVWWRERLTRPPPILSAAQCKPVQSGAINALICHESSTPLRSIAAPGFAGVPVNYTDFRGKGGGWRVVASAAIAWPSDRSCSGTRHSPRTGMFGVAVGRPHGERLGGLVRGRPRVGIARKDSTVTSISRRILRSSARLMPRPASNGTVVRRPSG
jgi:hypothetical protein